MATVLCINPWIVDFAAYNEWIEPLGLLKVAGVLRAVGHEVTLLDCLDRRDPEAPAPVSPRDAYGCGHFAKAPLPKPPPVAHVQRKYSRYGLARELVLWRMQNMPRPDAVLVTCTMTYWYPGAFEAIGLVKKVWPGIPVALGGIYATLCPDHARQSGADAVLCGPGEISALEWIGEVTGDARGLPVDPQSVLPAHDLRRSQGYCALRTTSGCPYHCPYCAAGLLQPAGFEPRPIDQVLTEIDRCAVQLGVSDIAFYDDALLVNASSHIIPILRGVVELGIRVRFHCPNGLHARYIDEPLAVLMKRAGFATIRLGLETIDPTRVEGDGKKVTPDEFGAAVRALLRAGFSGREISAYVLVGRPPGNGTSEAWELESARKAVAYAQGLGVRVLAAEYSPVPGTIEWHRAVVGGYIAANADPLLHNRAAYPCADRSLVEALKNVIRAGNLRISQGLLP